MRPLRYSTNVTLDGCCDHRVAMGGGKTHTMLALGLLAKRPKFRVNVMGDLYRAKDLGSVRVVAFSGRQNPQEGLWGEIAEQLGKKEFFKNPVQYVS